jgi:NAD(P)-dependent dehydrogenase (short-subunit alcohol dehydrogenase family)
MDRAQHGCEVSQRGVRMEKPLVVVTGASRGIGKAVVVRFAAEGYLLLVARHPEPLDGVPAEQIRQAAVDVADCAVLENAIREAEAVYGPTECLVNNAGFLKIGPIEGRSVADMSY